MNLVIKAKQFYVQNSQSLFKGVERPYWLAFCAILLEYFFYFSLILTPGYIKKQKQLESYASLLEYASIHMIPDKSKEVLIQLFLGINTLIILLIAIYFMAYFIKPYKQKRGYLIGIAIMNYNSILTVPSFIISLQYINIQGVVNMVFTFILSQISILQSNNYYNYIIYDHLSKRGSIWDSVKALIVIFSLIIINQIDNEHYYIFTLLYSLINSLNLINFNFYHNKSISKLFLSVNLCLSFISLISFFIMTVNLQYSIILILFITPCLCFQIGSALMDKLYFRIIQRIQQILDNKINDTSLIDSDKLIDFYTRYLVENLHFNAKKSKLFDQVYQQSSIFVTSINEHQHYQDEYTVSETNQNDKKQIQNLNIGQFILNEDKNAAVSLSNQLKQLAFTFEENQKFSRLINNFEKNQIKYSIRELFYLLEIEQNIPKLLIKLSEYTNQKKSSINANEMALVSYLKHQIQKRDAKNLINFIGLETAFNYEEELQKAGNILVEALKHKQNFLKTISKDNFDLQVILKTGPIFLQKRKEITEMIQNLAKQNDRNSEYQMLASIYQKTIQLDPDDRKFLKKLKFERNMQFMNSRMKKHLNLEEISKQSCLIIVSLANNNFGIIKKASKNCSKLIGYDPIDLIGKNCNLIQPPSIALHHNLIMKEAIENGKFRNTFKLNAPLIARTKEEFGVKIALLFQLQGLSDQNDQAGLIAQLKLKNNSYQKFALIDISEQKGYKIDVLSKPLFVEFFSKYYKTPKEAEGNQIHQMIPTLSNIGNYMKKENLNKLYLQTLSFHPDPIYYKGDKKKRFSDTCTDIMTNIKKGYFNPDFNNVYLIEMQLKICKRESAYEVIIIKFKSINRLVDDNHIDNAIEGILYPQWLDYGQVNEYQLQSYHNKLKEDIEYYNKPRISFNGDIQLSNSQIYINQKFNFNGSQSNNQIPKGSSSFLQIDHIAYPTEDHLTIEQQNTDRIEQLLDIHQIKSQHSPNQETIYGSPFQESKLDSYLMNKQIEELSLEDSHRNQKELKPHLFIKTSTKDTNIETLLSPVQTRNSQRIQQSVSDLLMKISQQKKESIQKIDQDLLNLQQKFQMEQEDQNSVSFEIEQISENKQTAIDQRSINHSNSSKGSQTSTLKKVIVQKLLKEKPGKTIQMILFYVACSFLFILLTVIITHINLQQQIDHQQISFSFSSWQDQYTTILLQSINCLEMFKLISIRSYTFSKSPYIEPTFKILPYYIQMLQGNQMGLISNIMNQDINKVFVKRELINQKIPFTYLTPSFKNMTINMTFFDSLVILSNFVPSLVLRQDAYGYVVEMELLTNAGAITQGLTDISEKQGMSELSLNDEIISSAKLTLILISLITAAMALIIVPFYSIFQARQEKILRYFATIEPESIADMYDSITYSLQKLILKKKSQIYQISKDIQQNMEMTNQIAHKKKKHVSTTSLPKVSLILCFYALLLLTTISVQPIVNYILTTLQVRQQTKIQSFVRSLYSFKSQTYSVYYSANSYAAKIAFPYISLIPLNYTQMGLQNALKDANKIGQTFLTSLYELRDQDVFSDSNIYNQVNQILSGDSCEILSKEQNFTLTYDQCTQIYGGAYKKGVLSAYSAFLLKMQQINEISMKEQDKSTFQQIDQYFFYHSPLEAGGFFTIIETSIAKLIELVDSQKDIFKKTIDNTQISLFIFEVSLLTLLFPIVVVPFFNYIKDKINTVVSMISIIQIKYILENSYMTSFIKSY